MCLDKVTKRDVVLKKDKKVWKAVRVKNNGDECGYVFSHPFNKHINKATPLYRTITSSTTNSLIPEYFLGFHCFILKKDAMRWGNIPKNNRYELYNGRVYKVMSYIIPAGTTVTEGTQDGLKVIVSPVLINPRVKE